METCKHCKLGLPPNPFPEGKLPSTSLSPVVVWPPRRDPDSFFLLLLCFQLVTSVFIVALWTEMATSVPTSMSVQVLYSHKISCSYFSI